MEYSFVHCSTCFKIKLWFLIIILFFEWRESFYGGSGRTIGNEAWYTCQVATKINECQRLSIIDIKRCKQGNMTSIVLHFAFLYGLAKGVSSLTHYAESDEHISFLTSF